MYDFFPSPVTHIHNCLGYRYSDVSTHLSDLSSSSSLILMSPVFVHRWVRCGSLQMINVFYTSVWKWKKRCSSLQPTSAALPWTLRPARLEPSYAATPRTAAPAATVVNTHAYGKLRIAVKHQTCICSQTWYSMFTWVSRTSMCEFIFCLIQNVYIPSCSYSFCPAEDCLIAILPSCPDYDLKKPRGE